MSLPALPCLPQVENLRGRLVKIITDFRTQVGRGRKGLIVVVWDDAHVMRRAF